MSKKYKNVYTILEKVKKGEIKSYYSDRDGLFGRINYYKKPDLIKPTMHFLDEDRLKSIMTSYMADMNTYKDFLKRNSDTITKQNITTDSFISLVKSAYKKFPEHMIRDVYKMFYHKIEKLEFADRDEKTQSKYKFLERANNPVSKIMSENSSLKSSIFARNIMANFAMRLALLQLTNPQEAKDVMDSINGNQDITPDDSKKASDIADKMLNSSESKKDLEDAIDSANELCKKMDEIMDKETQDSMFESINSGDGTYAGDISINYVDNVTKRLERIKLSTKSVKDRIKKLLDKSMNYFGSNKDVEFESILDSDNVGGLEDYQLLHPKIRKLFIEDIFIKNEKPVGKIDLYIDVSGSMGETCGIYNDEGKVLNKEDFAKAFAAHLLKMDVLNNIYKFNTSVKKVKTDIISISLLNNDGGTTINNVIKSIEAKQGNAIIITDAEDSCNLYSKKAFFIGIKGANFRHFAKAVLKEYSENDQVVCFDGERIMRIDKDGDQIC